jgi:protein-tyrosine phosphatase
MERTSATHPLQIAAVATGPHFGRVGITFCPGKFDPHGKTGAWDRDLAIDLDAIRDWGAAAVVTLIEPKEMTFLRVERLGEEVLRRNMQWFHLPIVDVSVPSEEFEQEWILAGEQLRSLLRNGRDVLVHCRGGLGRAGMIAARLLVELGKDPKQAIASVRAARGPGAIETRAQEKFILGLRTSRSSSKRSARDSQEGAMDWFETLTGFRETSYTDTRAKLAVEGGSLRSLVNRKGYGIGELELVSLQSLRDRVASGGGAAGRLKAGIVTGDVRRMHQALENAGALFQVASQFNLLEMVSPDVTPEDGVTRYVHDRTQGPACAIAAGAATIYRNYFAPVGDGYGQTRERQLDGLAELGEALAGALNRPLRELWTMRNGYAWCSRDGLADVAEHLRVQPLEKLDALRGKLRVGIHRDVEVTDSADGRRQIVSQAFCSALPIAYQSELRGHRAWQPFASLVLEAAYEATMLAGVLNARRGASNVVLLTQLGGGAFGNDEKWINAAMLRALELVRQYDLDVKLVSYRAPSPKLVEVAEHFN